MRDLIIRGGTIVDGTGEGRPSSVTSPSTATASVEVGQVSLTRLCARLSTLTGKIVTPGFVDIHTHYDGQATWDPLLAPSQPGARRHHGAVMGNCGVGFAPVAP